MLSLSEWDKVRKDCYKKADYKCEICGGKGPKHPVECHEIWEYNHDAGIQKLINVIALCPNCHKTKHYGLARILGKEKEIKEHFMKINNCTKIFAEQYILEAFELWNLRNKITWKLNITKLDELKK